LGLRAAALALRVLGLRAAALALYAETHDWRGFQPLTTSGGGHKMDTDALADFGSCEAHFGLALEERNPNPSLTGANTLSIVDRCAERQISCWVRFVENSAKQIEAVFFTPNLRPESHRERLRTQA